ncbi:MAG: methytransferase partner Trm112 [Thermoplasmatota archaeon]
MRKDLVEIVCCPVHKTPLALTVKEQDPHGDIIEGHLRCSTCKFDYPIEEGIPNLLPPEYHVDGVKAKTAKPNPSAKKASSSKSKGSK